MKHLLIILAGLVAIMAGGCVVVLGNSTGPMMLPLLIVTAANLALIIGVVKGTPWVQWLLWIFVVLDFVLAAFLAVALGGDRYVGAIAIAAAVFLVFKAVAEGVIAYRVRSRLPGPEDPGL